MPAKGSLDISGADALEQAADRLWGKSNEFAQPLPAPHEPIPIPAFPEPLPERKRVRSDRSKRVPLCIDCPTQKRHPSLPGTSFCRFHTPNPKRTQALIKARAARARRRACRSVLGNTCLLLPAAWSRLSTQVIPFDWFPTRLRTPTALLSIPERGPLDAERALCARLLHRGRSPRKKRMHKKSPWTAPRCYDTIPKDPKEERMTHPMDRNVAKSLCEGGT